MIKKNGVSFIVTVFNKELFIEKTLQSVKKNLFGNNQIIIIDDGSTDDSVDKIRNFIKRNHKINIKLLLQKNSGPSIATNNCLKHVIYSHIKMVDGDDILAPDSVTFLKNEMERLNLDLIYGDWKWDKDHFTYKFQDQKNIKTTLFKNAFEKFLLKGWGGSSNLMVKTSALLEVNGCDEDVFIQDYSLPLKIAGYHHKKKGLEKFRVGLSNKIICVGPKFIKNRIITNNAQTLFDLSMTSINFIENHPLVEKEFKKKLYKKIVRRCWKWKKSTGESSYLSKNFFRYLGSYLYFKPNFEILRYEVINTWKNERSIRILYQNKKYLDILIYVGLDLLGDALIKIPFLIKLKQIFPNSKITWLAGKGSSTMAGDLRVITDNLIDEVVENGEVGSSVKELFKKIKFTKNFDIIIDTQKRLLTSLILKKIKTKIFISQTGNFFLSDLWTNRLTKNQSLSEELLELSYLFSEKRDFKTIDLRIPDVYSKKANKFYERKNTNKIAICPGASNNWKRWSENYYLEVANFLYQKKFLPVFFLGPNEKELYYFFKEKIPNAAFPLQSKEVDRINPIYTIAYAKECLLGISNDTGCGHLLSITNMPLITLFGETNPVKFSPYNTSNKNIILRADNYGKKRDINQIPIKAVTQSIQEVLKALEKIS